MTTDQYPLRYSGKPSSVSRSDTTNLADLLERILDKGIVIAGDITVSLVDVELLTIRLRLLIASVDKAREMGINWWESDRWLSTANDGHDSSPDESGRRALEQRLDRLEAAIDRLGLPDSSEVRDRRRAEAQR